MKKLNLNPKRLNVLHNIIKRKQSDNGKPIPEFSNVTLAQTPYKSWQSLRKAINKCRVELLQSPRKKEAVVPGLAKEVRLLLQNDYEKQTHRNTIGEELKAEVNQIGYILYNARGQR